RAAHRAAAAGTPGPLAPARAAHAPCRVLLGRRREGAETQGCAEPHRLGPHRPSHLRGRGGLVLASASLHLQRLTMASVHIKDVQKYFGGAHIIRGVSIDIPDGEFAVLVGPSGCGKSTLLRMIAGLEEISGGTIEIGGKVVNDMQPKERDIAMVFQNYALYPHMKVRDNMALTMLLPKL